MDAKKGKLLRIFLIFALLYAVLKLPSYLSLGQTSLYLQLILLIIFVFFLAKNSPLLKGSQEELSGRKEGREYSILLLGFYIILFLDILGGIFIPFGSPFRQVLIFAQPVFLGIGFFLIRKNRNN